MIIYVCLVFNRFVTEEASRSINIRNRESNRCPLTCQQVNNIVQSTKGCGKSSQWAFETSPAFLQDHANNLYQCAKRDLPCFVVLSFFSRFQDIFPMIFKEFKPKNICNNNRTPWRDSASAPYRGYLHSCWRCYSAALALANTRARTAAE